MNTTRNRIEKKILLRAPRSRVWRALSDSKEFGSWFGVELDGPFAPGAKLRGRIVPTTVDPAVAAQQKAYEGLPCNLSVERVEPERLLSFRWHPDAVEPGADLSPESTTLIEFVLEEQAGGVLLTVTESGFDRIPLERRAKAFTSNSDGWDVQMKLIEKYLAQAA